jgi:Ca2+/H+ antiporter, TMEM165/GDT1 family
MNMNRQFIRRGVRFRVGKIIGFVLLGIIGIFVFGSIVMLLWNNLMPVIFHLPLITFWQALGLLILAKILFSGFRGGPKAYGSRWKRDALREGWANMTPEQQEKFRQEWGRRCGKPFPPEPNQAETK